MTRESPRLQSGECQDRTKMLALSIVLILTVTLSVIGMVSISVKAVQLPVVAATFYCWFGYEQNTGTWPGGFGTSHWGDKRTTTVNDHPLGYYSSLNNQTVGSQLSEIMVAGIDVMLVSWWNDYTTPCITNLFKYIEANNIPIKVAIIVEPFAGFTFPHATDWAWTLYYSQFPNIIFNWQGKPLLVFFESTIVGEDQRYTIRTIANGAGQDWIYVQGMETTLQDTDMPAWVAAYYTNLTLRRDNIVTVTPRFDNYYQFLAGGRFDYIRFDVNYTLDMYGQEWRYAINNHASMVLLTSWNEYTESSELEPHYMTNGKYVNLIPETIHYSQIFHAQTAVATPEFPAYVPTMVIMLSCICATLVIPKRRHHQSRRHREL